MFKRLKQQKRQQISTSWLVGNTALLLAYGVVATFFVYNLFKHHFLAFKSINIIIAAVLFLSFAACLVLIALKRAKFFTCLTLFLLTVATSLGLYGIQSTIRVTDKFNQTASVSEVEMSIVVPVGSTITNIKEVASLQAPLNNDSMNIQELLADIKSKQDLEMVPEVVESYPKAYENILSGATQAMVMNSAYSSLLEMTDPDYASKVRSIYTYKITKEVPPAAVPTNSNVLNVYVSGIDSYGSISTVSRSDVNILMTINMDTHKVLLTTIPRDAYVQIPNGGGDQYDKLTHAGIYGVETSVQTLENLYGVDINYYARINFSSFLKMIDLLGGIEVENDQAFSAGGYDYPVGLIELNSEQALRFVRERYSLQAGDADRGRNQEKVIAAIFHKLASLGTITKFTDLVNGLQNSVQTNMTLDTMMQLANAQLSSGQDFTVISQDITGTGSVGALPSYAMPSASLYMLSIDQASLDAAKQAIHNTMEGN